MKNINNQKGFSIVELIVVLVIVGIFSFLVLEDKVKTLFNDAHNVVVDDFLSKKIPTALLSCSLKNKDLTNCDKNELINEYGVANELSVGGWGITPNNFGAVVEVGFTKISNPSETINLVQENILLKNKVNSASNTIVGNAGTLTVSYVIR